MTVGRRKFLGFAGVAAAAVALPTWASASAQDGRGLTTLARTLGRGDLIRQGELGAYHRIAVLPGEPHRLRTDLAAAAGGRQRRRTSLLSFVHLTDQHVVDVQSPTRVEFSDRFADGQCAPLPLQSAHRPHEAASARLVDAMLRQLRAIRVSPVSGRPLQAAICTGDNTDNQQGNELGLFLGLMDGGRVAPQSGDPQRYQGVQRSGDRAYWHPEPEVDDQYKRLFGFPDAPGWLDAALAPFDAVGAGTDWYTCYGNHDGLAQGNAPVNPAFAALAVGGLKVVGAPSHVGCNSFEEPGDALTQLLDPTMPVIPVTPDTGRQYVSRRQWIGAHLASPGSPGGHGFTEANRTENRAYYSADVGPLRWIVLDTVNPGGYAEGSIGERQLAWLSAELDRADAERVPVILFSHHGLRSLDNPVQTPDPLAEPGGNDLPRHTSATVEELVSGRACVIAWVNGHTHENLITARDGFWDIGTAAHVDWPGQSRLIEVLDNHDGTWSIFTTMVDHADDPIASLARELMGNDPQAGFATGTGGVDDRNTELVIPAPFA